MPIPEHILKMEVIHREFLSRQIFDVSLIHKYDVLVFKYQYKILTMMKTLTTKCFSVMMKSVKRTFENLFVEMLADY